MALLVVLVSWYFNRLLVFWSTTMLLPIHCDSSVGLMLSPPATFLCFWSMFYACFLCVSKGVLLVSFWVCLLSACGLAVLWLCLFALLVLASHGGVCYLG